MAFYWVGYLHEGFVMSENDYRGAVMVLWHIVISFCVLVFVMVLCYGIYYSIEHGVMEPVAEEIECSCCDDSV